MPNNGHLIVVNGVVVPPPYVCEWSLQDVSASSAGRTEDALMHKERIAQKRKLKLSWRAKTPDVTSSILNTFNPEYIDVTYFDALSGTYETRTFYTGDKQANVKIWTVGNKLFETISFDIIER